MSVAKAKRTSGTAQAQAPHDVGDGLGLAAVGFQELEPGRRGGEEVARFDPRARGLAAGLKRALQAVLDDEPQALRRARRPGADFESRHRGDRWQRLAAKSERQNGVKIAIGKFRGRVPLDREAEVGFVHAVAVVGHPDEAPPARFDGDLDLGRAGVERVLDEFLDRRSRPLDDLARGDAVDEQRIEAANRHGRGGPSRAYRIGKDQGEGRPRDLAAFTRVGKGDARPGG